ncbi:peptidase [Microtetraspora sp. NBRC 13810]|uniref:alpha/beta hydrolase n=1 Tax=Microtetraspora sp. NBRC 13810 TaxID=3030990 RepID=UPI0024A4FBFA|nr:alpha/beta hydrolase [Microtetraspora sp. NBRC 13810]GLW08415.1 peptidase [Microtetraspora sp. NBRC 13810]
MKRVIGIVSGLSLLAVGADGAAAYAGEAAPGERPSSAPRASVVWGPCGEGKKPGEGSGGEARGVECGNVRVPLDYRTPGGQTIQLALKRVRGTASRDHNHLGVLLVNPGGPGASGLDLGPQVAAALPAEVAARYDVIGFDPRGVGSSEPALTCVDAKKYYEPPRLDAVPANAAEERALVNRARGYAQACANRWSWMLPHINTENSARDLDVIRMALGEEKISYLGYSYGSYLGAVYATLYPSRVRRLVLDSVVDPAGRWYESNIAQNHAFERRHADFLAWVARHDDVYRLGADARAVRFAWYSMRDRVRRRPAAGVVGPSELDDTFMIAGYTATVWPQLAEAFSGYARRGETRGLVAAFRQHGENDAEDENNYAVYLSVQCRDAPWPRDWRRWHADMTASHRSSRFLTWPNAWYNAPCAFWPERGGTPVPIKSSPKLPPILMLQSERDAATPYAGALRMRRVLPSARLVTEPGGNHGVSLGGNTCVDRHLVQYLRDGSLPGGRARTSGTLPDLKCPGVPAPRPAAAQAGGR